MDTGAQVFLNPMVAGRRRHDHLFSEPGCFFSFIRGNNTNDWYGKLSNFPCGGIMPNGKRPSGLGAFLTPLPPNYAHLNRSDEKEREWEIAVFGGVSPAYSRTPKVPVP